MLTVVVVNYTTAPLAVDCLRSLATERERDPALASRWHVVVADNASPDDSADVLEKAVSDNGWGAWCRVARLPRNGGFAYGNNAAVVADLELWAGSGVDGRTGRSRYVLLLNPDTVVRPGAMAALLAYAEAHPEVGIFGSRLEDADGTPQCSAFRFPGVLSEFESAARLGVVTRLLRRWQVAPPVQDRPHRCDWVAGACMLVRRELWERLGGMDEGYFMYFEEVDFCLRARRAGWLCHYVPAARVVHLVGQSSGVTDTKRPPTRLPAYWFESRRRYFQKNHGTAYRVAADVVWTAGQLLYRLHTTLRGRKRRDPPRLLRDFWCCAMGRRPAA
ncbi:MAG: glycosyltransferase family 2 protein [Tepidisphaerales bacterium]